MVNEDRVEQRAKAVYELWRWLPGQSDWPSLSGTGLRADFLRIARAELEREGRLVEALMRLLEGTGGIHRGLGGNQLVRVNANRFQYADNALAAYEAEFAPPQRTVEQVMVDAARNAVRVPQGPDVTMLSYTMVPTFLWDELAAALKRKDA